MPTKCFISLVRSFKNRMEMNKQTIVTEIRKLLFERIEAAQTAIQHAQTAANEETKSSVGDKYETGRAMSQLDIEMYSRQLEQATTELTIVEKIDTEIVHSSIELGALATTSMGTFFIAVGVGKIIADGIPIMAISPKSPIGEQLLHKKITDSIDFRGKKVVISEII